MRDPRLTLNSAALLHNVALVRRSAPNSKILAMVKANAYGHGALPVANLLAEHVDALGVACLQEALELRNAGILTPLVLMEGVFSLAELTTVMQDGNMQLVVHQPRHLDWLRAWGDSGHKVTVWLKVDSGMHRLGFQPHEVATIHRQLSLIASVKDIILTSHFACADEPQNSKTQQQLSVMETLAHNMPQCARSLSNSAAILAWPQAHHDWVRPGIMLYGSSPFSATTATDCQLQPVMTLSAQILAIQPVAAGESVGYGNSWTSSKDTRIGVVGIGYGDGYPRHLPNGSPVLHRGQRLPRVGRVSMDMITIDLGDHPAEIGDEVILWGDGLPADEIATLAGTISYELFCQMTPRLSRWWI